MFDISWSEFAVIAVVALVVIGPKELPGVLRMVGQWVGKARKMAGEFQGQFREAMREAEMADLKQSFDEIKEAARGFSGNNIMTSLHKDVGDALKVDHVETAAPAPEMAAMPAAETLTGVNADVLASQPLAIVPPSESPPVPEQSAPAGPEMPRDAKAS